MKSYCFSNRLYLYNNTGNYTNNIFIKKEANNIEPYHSCRNG